MRKTIQLILLSLVFLFLLDRIMGAIFERQYRNLTTDAIGRLNHILEKETNYDLLVVGSSHALHHLQPEVLDDNAYNIGWDGTAIDMHLALLKVLEAKNKLPKTIILSLDEKMVFDTGIDYLGIEELAYYYDENEWIRQEINDHSIYNAFLYFFKSYKFNGQMTTLLEFGSSDEGVNMRGFEGLKPKEGDERRIELAIEKKAQLVKDEAGRVFELNAEFLRNFKTLVRLAEDNAIELIVFSSPTLGPKRYSFSKSKLYEFMCQEDITYLDYRNLFRFDEEVTPDRALWKDLSHMNEQGAKIFSERMKADLDYIRNRGDLPEELKFCGHD